MKMKKISLLIAIAVLSFFPHLLKAQDHQAEEKISVSEIYSFAAAEGARSAAIFMTITYPETLTSGDITDRLISVETPVAGKVEIHTTLIEDDVMMMRRMDALPLPPMGKLVLSPGGAHIMLFELKQELKVGETFPVTLGFEKSGQITAEVTVRAPGDVPDQGGANPDHSDGHGSAH